VLAVGKIEDIFAGSGISEAHHTQSNMEGIFKTIDLIKQQTQSSQLIFSNLVDFDMLYGHRNDVYGYANALAEFDAYLPEITEAMGEEDLLIITADHGCDPTTTSTDHSREYVPLLAYRKGMKACNLGIRKTFSDIASTIASFFGVTYDCMGESFLDKL
jgi:phosphopentomutase